MSWSVVESEIWLQTTHTGSNGRPLCRGVAWGMFALCLHLALLHDREAQLLGGSITVARRGQPSETIAALAERNVEALIASG
jgi:hypothetical protein